MDATQRTGTHISIYAMRLVSAGMWYLGVALMLGVAVRLSGVVGALFIFKLLIGLYNDPTGWPWTYVGIICTHDMLAVVQAGHSFGIDNLLAKRFIPGLRLTGLVDRALALAS